MTEVKVAHRPVTREGMTGIRVKTAGTGRKVQDTSYYLGLLRTKNSELTIEITSMKKEVEQSQKDNKKYGELERKYESLIKEVRTLEGNLADYNLAMDKSRTSTDPFEIARYHQALQERNNAMEKEVDSIFLRRQKEEDNSKRISEKIMAIHKDTDERVAQLAPDKLQRYKAMMNDDFMLTSEVEQKNRIIEQMKQKVSQLEVEIRNNTWRNEFLNAERKLASMLKEREAMKQENESLSMDPETARTHLLQKVKTISNLIKETEKKAEEQETTNENAQRALDELTTDIEERKGESNDSKKYEVLFQRDKEMSDFIENFDETRQAQIEDQDKTKQMVVALLEHISCDLSRKNNMPTKESVKAMRDDLSFKKRQVDASQSTQQRLQQELAKRNQELEKIDGLDTKIQTELTTLKNRIETMHQEMVEFENIGKLRTQATNTGQKLRRLTKSYAGRRDSVRQQLPVCTSKYEKVKTALDCETMGNLKAQEVRVRVNEQNIFKLTDFIRSKGRETDYTALKEGCKGTLKDLNDLVIKSQSEAMSSVLGPGQ